MKRQLKYLAKLFAYALAAAWVLMIIFGNIHHSNPTAAQPIGFGDSFRFVIVILVISTFLDFVKRARAERAEDRQVGGILDELKRAYETVDPIPARSTDSVHPELSQQPADSDR